MKELLKQLNLPADAVNWLVSIWDSIQTFDDFQDSDIVESDRLHKCIWDTLVAMPSNPFYVANSTILLPIITINILKWHAANLAELEHQPTAVSFSWRAGYYELVLMVYAICFGWQEAMVRSKTIMSLYGEKYDDYIKEFNNA